MPVSNQACIGGTLSARWGLVTPRRIARRRVALGKPALIEGPPSWRLPERSRNEPALPRCQLFGDALWERPGEADNVRDQHRTVVPANYDAWPPHHGAAAAHTERVDLRPADHPTTQVVAVHKTSPGDDEPVGHQNRAEPHGEQQPKRSDGYAADRVALAWADSDHAQADDENIPAPTQAGAKHANDARYTPSSSALMTAAPPGHLGPANISRNGP
jgi:hypothetical protein